MLAQRENNRILIFLVFSFFFIINIASTGGHFDSYDGIETFLVTESMVLHHSPKLFPDVPSIQKLHFDIRTSVATNKAAQGKPYDVNTPLEPIYIFRSLLLSAIAVPFYYAAIFFSVSPITVVAIFVNPLILALISVVIFCFSLEVHRSRKIAFILSLIFGVCSFAWSYTTTLFPQPLQALLIITSAFFIFKSDKQNDNNNNKRNYYAGLGGLLLGFSLFAHPTSAIVIPAFVGYSIFSMWRYKRKSLLAFLIMLSIVLSFMGLLNYWRFGSFTEFGYGNQVSLSVHHGWNGLVGLILSPGTGIIFFFPMVFLLPLALKYTYLENKGLFLLFSYVIFANWLYFGTLSYPWEPAPTDWSGDGWGPRYLVPILPFITMAFGALLVHLKNRLFLKLSIIILCTVSFFVSLLGTIVWYQYGESYGWEREGLWQYDHITFQPAVSSWDLMTWFPQYSPIIIHLKVLMSDYLSKVIQGHLSGMSKTQLAHDWAFVGLAPCSYDIYIYCKAGVIPILLLACIAAGVAASIVLGIYDNHNTKFFLLRFKNYAKVRRQE